MNTLNTLDPKALPTLMLPRPWRATIMEAKMLGNEVPAADMVRPAIVWETWHQSAKVSTLRDIMKERMASHNTLIEIEVMYQVDHLGLRTSGTV